MAKSRPSSESGFAIIEVVVSAAVLAIVALAVLSGIDGAQGSSGREKARAVASALAEQDQERMRAMSVEGLKTLTQAPDVTLDGATYKTTSEAVFVTDDTGGTPSCGNSSNNAEYFHITSTVRSNVAGSRIPAVRIDSLVSPSVAYSQTHGTLGVKIVDRTGAGIKDVNVSATGGSSQSGSTDASGCIVWRSIAIGSYTVSINVSGYCDETGATNITRQQTVSPNTVSFVNLTYDKCAGATVNVRTHTPGTNFSTSSDKLSKARDLSDISSNGSLKSWPASNPTLGANAFTFTTLFPYVSTPYGFFTGECQYQNPEKAGIANYFTSTNALASMTANPAPATNSAMVFQPPVNLRLSRSYVNGPVVADRVAVYFTLLKPAAFASDTCTDDPFVFKTMDWPATGWGTRPTNYTGYVSQTSALFDPGLPFGKYSICLWDTVAGRGYRYSQRNSNFEYDNTTANGRSAVLDLNIASGNWTTGDTCS